MNMTEFLLALAERLQAKGSPEFTCEVCSAGGVERVGDWDYCERGHTYVGTRAGEIKS